MTIHSLTLHSQQLEALRSHLFREDGFERAAYLLCSRAVAQADPWDRQRHEKFLVRYVVPVPDTDVIEHDTVHVTWSTRSFVRALCRAERENLLVAIAHNHPNGALEFSGQDDSNEKDLIQAALDRNGPGTRLISLILTPNGQVAGRIWRHPNIKSGHQPLTKIRVVGSRISLHYSGRGKGFECDAFHRQALVLGSALNQDLAQLRVGVVGCGGTGSAVAMLLARLGVGQIALIDNDVVERTNLNRLHGARQADADAMRPKAEVTARSITELGLGCRALPFRAWVGDPQCRDVLKACDVIFGCTDDHDGRLLLNRFAYYYLAPVFDVGLAIEPDPSGQALSTLDGRVTVLMPGYTCLMCRRVVDPRIAAEEALKRRKPEEYDQRKAEAYVFGEGNPSPAVVTFTTEVACMGVNELIHRLQGFRGDDGHAAHRVRLFRHNEDRRQSRPSAPHCLVCANDEAWGTGDVEPFLGRVN